MKDKIQVQLQGSIYTFRKSQISRADVREFLTQYDPVRQAGIRLEELLGRAANHADRLILKAECFHLSPDEHNLRNSVCA